MHAYVRRRMHATCVAWRLCNHEDVKLVRDLVTIMPRSTPHLPRSSWHARARCRACRARSASGLARSRAHASCVPRMVCACSVQCRAFVSGAECCSVQSHGSMLCIVGVRASRGRRRARPQRRRRADEGRRGSRGGRARSGRGAWVGRWAAHLACVPTCVSFFLLRECIGSKLNNLGPSYVTLTFPPRGARRLTVTTSHQFYELHTSIHSDRKRFT